MWKLSCLFLLFITIVNCSTYHNEDNVEIESSRNDRSHDNRKRRTESKNIDYLGEDRPYEDDSEEFQGGKLIGKWRNNGAAFEPKWRDGDSVPLVPFNAAKQTKVGRHDTIDGSKYQESSHAVTKPLARDVSVGRTPNEKSFEDTIPVAEDKPLSDNPKEDRFSFNKDYERRYREEYDDSRSSVSEFSSQSKKTRIPTILTDDLRYETTEDAETTKKSSDDVEKEKISSRSRYRDTFQVHPNEYDLNDEEYQKPRPRKRRPPQNYEFSEMRAPTYSITWSTERYIESTPSPDRPKWSKDPDSIRRRPEKTNLSRRDRNRNAGMENQQRVSENAELKSLLKMQQIEGLSLSELLQRRNLTLNDLLKGKAEVINVLKASESHEEDATEFFNIKPRIFETKKNVGTTEHPKIEHPKIDRPKWKPSQSRVKNPDYGISLVNNSENDVPNGGSLNQETQDEESLEHLDSAETEDGQRKNNDNEKLSAIVRLTKPIILPRLKSVTEKSIGVTTSSVTREFVEVQQNDEGVVKSEKSSDEDEIMEFSDFTMNKNDEITTILAPETTTMRNVDFKFEDTYQDSGSTLSIEHILGTTEQIVSLPATTQEPNSFDNKVNSIVIEANRLNGSDIISLDFEYQSDEPQEISNEKSEEELAMSDQPYESPENDKINEFSKREWKNHQIFSTSSKPYEVVVSEIEPEARAEIFELFSSGSSAKRLERLLKSRNMSIDELIALRQRGSSKVHMAEVLRAREAQASRSRNQHFNSEGIQFAKSENVATTEEISADTTIDDLSDVEIETTTTEIPVNVVTEQQTNIASVGTEQTLATFTTQQINVYSVRTERTESSTTEGETVKPLHLLDLLTAFDSLPFSVRPDLDQENVEKTKIPSESEASKVPEDFMEKTKRPDLPPSLVEVGIVEEVAKEDSIPFDDSVTRVRTNFSSTLGEDKKNLSKVRPSIIASGAILGVTIVVFLAIFIVCRIRQKQKYTYRNTFSRAVFQGPVMTARKLSNSSSLNTIMVNVVATSTNKRPDRHEQQAIDDEFDFKSDIENDSLDANDSWDTIPDFMK